MSENRNVISKRAAFVIMATIVVVLMVLLTTGCSASESKTNTESESTEPTVETDAVEEPVSDDANTEYTTLVAYFSGTGNTARVAQQIAEATNGQLYEIQAVEPYTEEELSSDGYYENNRPYLESQDNTLRPEIGSAPIPDASSYAKVFLGYPIWYGTAPDIIYTFLDKNNFSQAEIYPFCTSGSSGIEQSEDMLKSLYPSLQWMPGERFSSSATQEQVDAWIRSLS